MSKNTDFILTKDLNQIAIDLVFWYIGVAIFIALIIAGVMYLWKIER